MQTFAKSASSRRRRRPLTAGVSRIGRASFAIRLIIATCIAAMFIGAPVALAASKRLSKTAGKRAITAVFDQELAWASGPVQRAHVGPCGGGGRRPVVCDTAAYLNNGTTYCSKYYRAKRTRSGKIAVTESTNGGRWRSHARSHCVS